MESTLRGRRDGGVGRCADSGSSLRRIFRAVYAGCVPGQWELIALVFVLLLLFGSKQIPQIARQLGRGMREVKETVADVDPREDVKRAMDTKPIEAPDDESSAER